MKTLKRTIVSAFLVAALLAVAAPANASTSNLEVCSTFMTRTGDVITNATAATDLASASSAFFALTGGMASGASDVSLNFTLPKRFNTKVDGVAGSALDNNAICASFSVAPGTYYYNPIFTTETLRFESPMYDDAFNGSLSSLSSAREFSVDGSLAASDGVISVSASGTTTLVVVNQLR